MDEITDQLRNPGQLPESELFDRPADGGHGRDHN